MRIGCHEESRYEAKDLGPPMPHRVGFALVCNPGCWLLLSVGAFFLGAAATDFRGVVARNHVSRYHIGTNTNYGGMHVMHAASHSLCVSLRDIRPGDKLIAPLLINSSDMWSPWHDKWSDHHQPQGCPIKNGLV